MERGVHSLTVLGVDPAAHMHGPAHLRPSWRLILAKAPFVKSRCSMAFLNLEPSNPVEE